MYAVIFKANIRKLDEEYAALVEKLHALALEQYACLRIDSASQDGLEITVSYWESLEAIKAWKKDPLHQQAQQRALQDWYADYQVEILELLRQYSNGT
ncbi:MAG: antibiotic biosynthesis monooxygenase [Gammaproteobacteria bacterium]|nr:antibiotic biosynthesis monooxygenase [Gammaproteobacteria bacterium]MAY01737.1 antibiotic biosynthesis monooxygenase [Gammaproteobacteria bacterium]|tara:strand:+ start:233 stop:526 length:294 start_codon:yes stop_codon:yes gene_type:complete